MPSEEPLVSPYRLLRRVESVDAPWPGLLASAPGRASVLLVDAELLTDDWPGWDAAESGHVLGPVDIVRSANGHQVALPVCTERIGDFLLRRGGTPLSDGERVTIAVSIGRGVQELTGMGEDRPRDGSWWLTEAGQPIFAAHPGGEPAAVAGVALLHDLTDGSSRLGGILHEIAAAVEEPRTLLRMLPHLEDRLFALAAPEPLATAVLAPRRARELGIRSTSSGSIGIDSDDTATAPRPAPRRASVVESMGRHIDADLADLVSQATTGVWRRLRHRADRRSRRPLIVSATLAAGVLAVGMLWPSGDEGPAVAEIPTPSPMATDSVSTGTATPAVAPTTPSGQPAALADIAMQLLTARTECAGDPACLGGVVEDPGATIPAGVVDLPASERAATLLDDFGGAAVLRIDGLPPAAGDQLVVLIRRQDEWLLRDVHDIAEQP